MPRTHMVVATSKNAETGQHSADAWLCISDSAEEAEANASKHLEFRGMFLPGWEMTSINVREVDTAWIVAAYRTLTKDEITAYASSHIEYESNGKSFMLPPRK